VPRTSSPTTTASPSIRNRVTGSRRAECTIPGIALGPIEAAPREQPLALAVAPDHETVPIVLDFVHPGRSGMTKGVGLLEPETRIFRTQFRR
jgi:hypothetical protein